jgi:hypothetical protein
VSEGRRGPSPRKRLGAAIVIAVVALASAAALAGADGSTDPSYVVYGGCGVDEGTAPSHFCHRGDPLGAFFESKGQNVAYQACATFPGGKSFCAEPAEATAGILYVNKITSHIVGPIRISWSVGSVQVGSWTIRRSPKPIVPQFGINPLIVSGTHRLFGLLVRHVPGNLRVRAWRSCPRLCRLKLHRVSRRHGNQRYRIAATSAASFKLGDILYVEVDAPGRRMHGAAVWGRLYVGKLVGRNRGRSRDTSIRRVGPLLCTPPGSVFRRATSCDKVP